MLRCIFWLRTIGILNVAKDYGKIWKYYEVHIKWKQKFLMAKHITVKLYLVVFKNFFVEG